jgi:hypothetical protein
MKRCSFIILFSILSISAFSQFADDALRMSQVYYQGTARSMALGGAIGAIGADFSSASMNPAGMGLFRTGEFNITPELATRNASSVYNGSLAESSRAVFNLSNLGLVMVKPLNSPNGWKFFQFGIGMNRINNYNSSVYMQGENTTSSKLDVYTELANGISYDQLENNNPYDLYPAWYLYLIDTIPGTIDQYYPAVEYGGVTQQQQITTRGSTNEWVFSFSGNYKEFLYIGATIGLPYTRYFRESTYAEFDLADTIPYFNNWSVTEDLTTSGWGINLKLGAIVKPTEWLRIGAAFHTPTYYWSMSDSWYTNTTAELVGSDSYKSIIGNFDYSLSTPLRAIGSIGFVIGQYGFISADYEFADYSTSKFSAKSYNYIDVNSDIRSSYKSTNNLRIGTEWRASNFSFRGGYALYDSPYANNLNDGKKQIISGGIGYKTAEYSIDFAYAHADKNEDYYLYSTENITTNPVENSFKTQSFLLSLKLYID